MNKNEIESLLLKAAEAYYNGNEIMSDAEYDALINKLKEIDPTNPLCANGLAASDSNGNEKKIKHTMTTGTLSKCANTDELKDWAKRQTTKRYSLELKIDGSSMELKYEHGKFVQAITRGDGFRSGYHSRGWLQRSRSHSDSFPHDFPEEAQVRLHRFRPFRNGHLQLRLRRSLLYQER